MTAVRVSAADNVAVVLADVPAGAEIEISGDKFVARAAIPAGHKVALAQVAIGDAVVKYGAPIGRATLAIAPGDHVHSHNLATGLGDVEDYMDCRPANRPNKVTSDAATFMGYRRADGRVGTRNEIWILPTVGCVANTAERIAAEARRQNDGRVDGVYAFAHPFGCSQLGDDLGGTRSLLAALASHPNAGGVLIIGLGCESNQIDALVSTIPAQSRARIRTLVSQIVEDEYEAGLSALNELIEIAANDRREPCDVSNLVIGVKCGGSDGFSGLTANPLVGRMTDRLVAAGGVSILTEIPEIFGAERPLLARCENDQVFDRMVAIVNDFKSYFLEHDQPIYENPSPGNIRGGITTLEEKSLGAAQKAGASAIVASALRYGERIEKPGLAILESPGNDAVSSTALAAAGATVILFTTGRGTPLGFPAPTIKIASNSALAEKKPRWIDFDAGPSLDDREKTCLEKNLWALLLSVASGKPTRSEENGERSIAIWKRGVTL
jgi:altronate hydrolase